VTSTVTTDFERDGFAVFPDAVDADSLAKLRTRIDEIVDDFDPTGLETIFSTEDQRHGRDDYFLNSGANISFFYEDGALTGDGELSVPKPQSLNKIGHAMHDLDEVFSQICRSGAFAHAASSVGMSDPRLLQSMVIFKNPKIGGEVHTHTDHSFLWTEPQSVIGFWLAIDEATLDNGCLWALPGGHRQPVKERFMRSPDGQGTVMETLDESPYPDDGWVPLEATPGTLIALHGSLPHRSEPNTSPAPRLAFTLHCIEAEAQYPANNWLQRPNLPLQGF